MSSPPPSLVETPSIMDKPTALALDGLRALLNDWEQQGIKVKDKSVTVSKKSNGSKPASDQSKAAVASAYSQYQKMASQEDKDLVTRWTETLNILLTFAGLLSAVITAFLLASQPDLLPQPIASTNKILLHIATHLDNTTDTSRLVEEVSFSSSTLRAMSYWHASLACSLMSAFGSLLSKQWVLHYQSTPIWANTTEEQCRLREIRAYGVSKWRMYAIIESLPVLLQLSVFLFYLGLAESVRFAPTLFNITTTSASVIAAFYVFTLVAGAISPSCPFKSPATDFLLKAMVSFLFLALSVLPTILLTLIFALLTPCAGIEAFRQLADVLFPLRTMIASPWRDLDYNIEQKLAQGPQGQVGVMFWWLHESKSKETTTAIEIQAIADVAMDPSAAWTACRMAVWRGGFGSWCFGVFEALKSENPPSKSSLTETDLICHLMRQPVEGFQAVRNALADKGVDTDREAYFAYICTTIREGWSDPSNTSTDKQLLPLEDMPRTTSAAYFQLQLIDWRYAGPESKSNSELLLQELPIALRPDYFADLTPHVDALIDAAALVSIALVPHSTSHYIQPIECLVDPPPLERLLQTLHRLSYYPVDSPPNQLVPQAVAAACRVVGSEATIKTLHKCESWMSGEFGMSTYRLMRLGGMWWHAESGTDPVGPGTRLVREIQCLMNVVIDHGIANSPGVLSNILPISSDSLTEIFDIYTHPQPSPKSTSEGSIEATKLVNFALTSRYATHLPPRQPTFFRRNEPPKYIWSATPAFTLQLGGRTQVVRQLMHDLGSTSTDSPASDPALRRASLTTVVAGQDIFLPQSLSTQYPHLTSELGRLATEMTQTAAFAYELTEDLFSTFDRWEELLRALGEFLQLLEQGDREGVWHMAYRPLLTMFRPPE